MKYYYLGASLPGFELQGPAPMSLDDFRVLCGEHLTRRDTEALAETLSSGESTAKSAFARRWRLCETLLRNQVVRARASRLQRDAAPYLREPSVPEPEMEQAVSEAFSRPTPQERELALDRFRWRKACEFAGYDPFTPEAILAYGVRLALAQRWSAVDADEGRRQLEQIVSRDPEEQKPEPVSG